MRGLASICLTKPSAPRRLTCNLWGKMQARSNKDAVARGDDGGVHGKHDTLRSNRATRPWRVPPHFEQSLAPRSPAQNGLLRARSLRNSNAPNARRGCPIRSPARPDQNRSLHLGFSTRGAQSAPLGTACRMTNGHSRWRAGISARRDRAPTPAFTGKLWS